MRPPACPLAGKVAAPSPVNPPVAEARPTAKQAASGPPSSKYAGFDGIVVKGASDTPVYLYINDGQAELRDASHLWGKTTLEVDTQLHDELDDKRYEIAQIGPAGEKLSIFAAIMNMSNRAWGRTGVGAVMGSKKLKAIVVRGTEKVTPADKKGVMALAKVGAKGFKGSGMESFGRYGTIGSVMGQQGGGGLPTNNWDAGVMDNAEGHQWRKAV